METTEHTTSAGAEPALHASRARERMAALIDRWVAAGRNVYVAKEPPFDPRDGGVPPAMWEREPDASGWVRWRATESNVREEDLARLESALGEPLPGIFRAWLGSRSFGPLETPDVRLVALWSDAPLAELESDVEAWSPLHRAGYLAIGDASDSGPLCLDLGRGGRRARPRTATARSSRSTPRR
jgi:hypothetical protein